MTTLEATQSLFDKYRAHDVEAMIGLFATNGTIEYVPIAVAVTV